MLVALWRNVALVAAKNAAVDVKTVALVIGACAPTTAAALDAIGILRAHRHLLFTCFARPSLAAIALARACVAGPEVGPAAHLTIPLFCERAHRLLAPLNN
jgi:hypothetical protein